jgi:hypothetical protein
VWGGDDAKMEAWMRAMAPSAPHADLAEQAGEWRYVVTYWTEPGGKPESVDGVSLKRMIMGGRYLEEELTGQFMGRPFQGFGVTGYDNVKKEYVGIWLDNARTGIEVHTGRKDEKGVQTFTSTTADPASGKPMRTRSVCRFADRDHHTIESYVTLPDGSEFLHMRIEYTRV